MDDSNDSQALAIKLLHTFDLEINTSRKISNNVLFMVPEQTGQKLLARAHRILNQETDHVGNVCPKVSFTAHDRELIISNGSLVHHICQIDTLPAQKYDAIFYYPEDKENCFFTKLSLQSALSLSA